MSSGCRRSDRRRSLRRSAPGGGRRAVPPAACGKHRWKRCGAPSLGSCRSRPVRCRRGSHGGWRLRPCSESRCPPHHRSVRDRAPLLGRRPRWLERTARTAPVDRSTTASESRLLRAWATPAPPVVGCSRISAAHSTRLTRRPRPGAARCIPRVSRYSPPPGQRSQRPSLLQGTSSRPEMGGLVEDDCGELARDVPWMLALMGRAHDQRALDQQVQLLGRALRLGVA